MGARDRVTYNDKILYLGKHRSQWVRDAARAVIASTDPPNRFLLMKQGFVTYEHRAKVTFKELAGFTFTSAELRWTWDYIARYMLRHERKWQAKFEKAYEQARAPGEPYRPSEDEPRIQLTDGDIRTENAHGRVRVH